jgi:hypothetical protein
MDRLRFQSLFEITSVSGLAMRWNLNVLLAAASSW